MSSPCLGKFPHANMKSKPFEDARIVFHPRGWLLAPRIAFRYAWHRATDPPINHFQPQPSWTLCNEGIYWLVGHSAACTKCFEIKFDKTIPSTTTSIAHLASIASQPKATDSQPNATAPCFSSSQRRSIWSHKIEEPCAWLDNRARS